MAISNFIDKEAEIIWSGKRSRRLPAGIQTAARRKLRMLNNAHALDDLRVPPGNMLEALKGDRVGQYSIRINVQWRLCFRWDAGQVLDVEIVDYH
ncbi:MAG: type II toxin-antitoxin system RelE/ParE family toxin [Alcanivorax sp.]|nr:type II toxin-antitoxin system RelE/ParE family toxin [Alcanivorax sp.]